jgi:hypothetical protein
MNVEILHLYRDDFLSKIIISKPAKPLPFLGYAPLWRVFLLNCWKYSIQQLLTAYPTIPLQPMGFPDNWQASPLWK